MRCDICGNETAVNRAAAVQAHQRTILGSRRAGSFEDCVICGSCADKAYISLVRNEVYGPITDMLSRHCNNLALDTSRDGRALAGAFLAHHRALQDSMFDVLQSFICAVADSPDECFDGRNESTRSRAMTIAHAMRKGGA